ncbi:ATP synthase F1 subunit delta [bacterium]|nr:ATP synthase F1 subunit delta [bacterium]
MSNKILVSAVARRYSKALLEASIKQKNFTSVLDELEMFRKQLSEVPLLRELFLNPAVPPQKRQKVLNDIGKKAGAHQLTLNFLRTLIHRDRLNLLDQIIVSAEQQFLERQGILVVEVITARPLEPEEERQLVARLEKFTGKKIQIDNHIDKSLVGGAITRIGTTLYDGSVTTQLDQMKLIITKT